MTTPRFRRLVVLATSPAVGLALFGRVLTFPFFWDDVLNFNWMHGRTVAGMWLDSTNYAYYRPLVFTVWQGLQLLFGPANSVAFQALSLLVLVLIGWLVSYVAFELKGKGGWPVAWLAGALAVTFPFAAQVVPNVGSAFHLYAPAALLLALAALIRYRRTGLRRWAVAAATAGILAPSIHEMLVTTGGVMGLWALLDPASNGAVLEDTPGTSGGGRTRPHTVWPVVGLVLLANVLWVFWWRHVPKTGGEGLHWVGWESIFQSVAYFAQGIGYPLQPLARPMMTYWGWSDVWAALVAGTMALAIAGVALVRRRMWRVLGFALGWYALASLPSILGLGFHYVVGNQRLMVFPGPAAAILWAATIPALVPNRLPRFARPAIGASLALGAIIPAALFLSSQMRLHELALGPVRQLAEIVRSNPQESILIINPLDWIAETDAWYALGHEAVEVLPAYLTLDGLAEVNAGVPAAVDGIQFSSIRPTLDRHWYNIAAPESDWGGMAQALPRYGKVYLARYTDEVIELQEVGGLAPPSPPSGQNVAVFDGQVTLERATLEIQGRFARLALQWSLAASTEGDVFRHVFDCHGNVLGLGDGPALGGVYPIRAWPIGTRLVDIRWIPLETLPGDGCYRAEVGIYSPADGVRAAARDAHGNRFENDVVPIDVESLNR